jgi:hypothetical protein
LEGVTSAYKVSEPPTTKAVAVFKLTPVTPIVVGAVFGSSLPPPPGLSNNSHPAIEHTIAATIKLIPINLPKFFIKAP